jgi:uncharacterized protein (TIGR02265 family)
MVVKGGHMSATPLPGTVSSLLDGRASPTTAGARERADMLQELGRHCDLAERLPLIPPSAKVRGVYGRSIDSAVEEAGKLGQYRAMFPRDLGPLTWHPLSEFLIRVSVAGALLAGPERVHDGMLEIGRRNALEFARSLLGRMIVRLLSRDPRKLLLQGVAARRQTCSYGSWQVSFPDERTAVMTMVEEYLYMDSFLMGAARGTFDAVGLSVDASTILDGRFHGRHVLRW